MSLDRQQLAWKLLQQAYRAQMHGDYDQAVQLYTKSLEIFPTAEAHTFLGWTYHFQGKVDEAIAECKRAIEVDPEFGNPYNDIGSYLIALGRFDEAIPWLEGRRGGGSESRQSIQLHRFLFNCAWAFRRSNSLARARHRRPSLRTAA